jgi:hypothetical protein
MGTFHSVGVQLAFDTTFSNLREHLITAVGNIYVAGVAVIALIALFRRRVTHMIEILVLGILVALVIYDSDVLKGFADALAGILGAPGPISGG